MLAQAIDVILVLVVAEGIGLVLWHWRTGRGVAPRRLLANLAAGFFLMLATRLAIGQASQGAIALCLAVAFLAHLVDLAARWR